MGLHARYIDLPEHFVVGVWSDELNRWIVMDPANDIHYEKLGVLATGRLLCDSYWKKNLKGLVKVAFDGTRTPVTMTDLSIYRMYSIVAKADQLKNPVSVHVNSTDLLKLVRLDYYHHYPMIGRDVIGFSSSYVAWKQPDAKEQFKDMLLSQDRDDFAYRMNQTIIFVARKDPSRGVAKLAILWPENSPSFKEFEVDLDDGGGWRTMASERCVHGRSIRAKTRWPFASAPRSAGWGKPAECRLFFKPAWWGNPPRRPPPSFPPPRRIVSHFSTENSGCVPLPVYGIPPVRDGAAW